MRKKLVEKMIKMIVKIIKCFQNKERNVFLKVCWAFADLLKSILFLSTPGFFPLNKSLLMMIGEVSSELMMFVGGGSRGGTS